MAKEKIETSLIEFPGGENLEEISAKERSGKKHLGSVYGIKISYCVEVGMKHYDRNISKEAKWYHINKEPDKVLEEYPHFIKVDFYGEKTNR